MRHTPLLVVLSLGLFPAAASAQFYQRPPTNPSRPALSPYLDVVRGGNPAINYYLGTLSELDRRAMAAQQQTMQSLLQQPQPAGVDPEDFIPTLTQTGHATGFGVYGSYFTFQNPPRSFFPNPATRKR